jgi:hypothetical protein
MQDRNNEPHSWRGCGTGRSRRSGYSGEGDTITVCLVLHNRLMLPHHLTFAVAIVVVSDERSDRDGRSAIAVPNTWPFKLVADKLPVHVAAPSDLPS